MRSINDIYEAIDANGFKESTLQLIDGFINDIENGRTNFSRFNEQEHAGLCKAGAPLIGASIIASYARRSITASCHAEGREGGPANWEIDEKQEQLIVQWAKAEGLWFGNSDSILQKNFGPMIAQGAEAIVYYREGDPTVTKERTSIYSTTEKALDAIVLHNYLFPETAMNTFGFTRDKDGLFRIILTQPYVRCLRLATKEEIDTLVFNKGFRDNWSGQGINYISDRIALEDMHPANVFIDEVSSRAICIDCIVKFVSQT